MWRAGRPAPSSGPGCRTGWRPAARIVTAAIGGGAPVYGVNTGFGALADTPVGEQDLTRLQRAIVRSHAAAAGEPLDDATVRAVLLLRARTLAAGYSGVRAELPRRLLEMLSLGLLPVIPGKGSVGASGDLAQLAHLAQPLIGEGRLGRRIPRTRTAVRLPKFSPSTACSRSRSRPRKASRWSTAPSRCRPCWPSP